MEKRRRTGRIIPVQRTIRQLQEKNKKQQEELQILRRSLEYINNEGELMSKRLTEIDRLFYEVKVEIFGKDNLPKIAMFEVEHFLKQTLDNFKANKELIEKQKEEVK